MPEGRVVGGAGQVADQQAHRPAQQHRQRHPDDRDGRADDAEQRDRSNHQDRRRGPLRPLDQAGDRGHGDQAGDERVDRGGVAVECAPGQGLQHLRRRIAVHQPDEHGADDDGDDERHQRIYQLSRAAAQQERRRHPERQRDYPEEAYPARQRDQDVRDAGGGLGQVGVQPDVVADATYDSPSTNAPPSSAATSRSRSDGRRSRRGAMSPSMTTVDWALTGSSWQIATAFRFCRSRVVACRHDFPTPAVRAAERSAPEGGVGAAAKRPGTGPALDAGQRRVVEHSDRPCSSWRDLAPARPRRSWKRS